MAIIKGHSYSEYLEGTDGPADWIYGYGGADIIDARDGNDNIDGGAGSDLIFGGGAMGESW